MLEFAWLIPVLPLLGFLLVTFTPVRRNGVASGWLTTALMAVAAALALGVAASLGVAGHSAGEAAFAFAEPAIVQTFRWAPAGDAAPITMGVYVDAAVAVMLVMVTVTSTCIHLFSLGYMAHDDRQGRFFSFISLFTAAMLLMLLASNLLLLFMAWEIMGLASYLLIGFWYDRDYADTQQITPRQAAIKAFITTRIGDVLLMIGLVYLWWQAGSMDFGNAPGQIFNAQFLERIAAQNAAFGMSTATAIALLIFCGTIGKAAQFPLHVWLPDAMEGPTPVSALIHAATMVAAGVFLVARTYPIFVASDALPVVAAIGTVTALGAALIACTQFDIKRILAYSTVSQLGFMVAALGLGGWVAALFHLLTHAFFKALLFLGAGSIIHGMARAVGHDANRAQDIRNMGGLRRFMPITFATYLVGYGALVGLPPLAGFWSKDEILADAFAHNQLIFWLLLLAALLTAFYMTRQVLLVFFGELRTGNTQLTTDHKQLTTDHKQLTTDAIHESPRVMLIPLVVLAVFAALGGFINTPFSWLPGYHWLANYLGQEPVVFSGVAMGLAVLATLLGISAGVALYRGAFRSAAEADPLARLSDGAFNFLHARMRFDELYAATVGRLVTALALMFRAIDERVLGPLVALIDRAGLLFGEAAFIADDATLNDGGDALARGNLRAGEGLRRTTTGVIQEYGALLFGGAVALAALVVYGMR